MKERFSAQEWQDLRVVPLAAFYLVAGADGKVDEKEVAAFVTELAAGAALKDELHRELALDIASDVQTALASAQANAQGHVARAKGILKAKLSADEYQRFVGSLFISGLKVARASGGGFLGLGDKISEEEKAALAVFATVWELDPASLSKFFS
jgi:hypothetical protein